MWVRFAVWMLAVVGALMLAPLLIGLSYGAEQEHQAMLAFGGLLLMIPAGVWSAWRFGWWVYRLAVREARDAHKT